MADKTPEQRLEDASDASKIRSLQAEELGLANILRLKLEIVAANKQSQAIQDSINKLNEKELKNVQTYDETNDHIKEVLKDIEQQQAKIEKSKGKQKTIATAELKTMQGELAALKTKKGDLEKTAAVALTLRKKEADIVAQSLKTEKQLIKDINKQRGLGFSLLGKSFSDLFRSKAQRQLQTDIARAQAGGGANIPPGGGGGTTTGGAAGGGGGKGMMGALIGAGGIGLIIAGIAAAVEKLKAPFLALGNVIKGNLAAPLAQVNNLVNGGIGGGYGVGGGAIGGGGATSILGGIQDIASKIPFIGGLLGGLVGAFKAVADLVLGLDQGITNFARNLGISKDQAKGIKEEFRAVAKASDSIVVNETRLMESQAELTKTLGIRSRFSDDILENNIKLKEIAGLELETRKALVQTSVIQGRSATQLTKNVLAQSKAFEFETGVAFEFRDVLSQASKQAGVLGLIFTNNDKKLTSMYMRTKAMGFELKQLDGLASSFLDFETSISKEFEAQVLTGKQLNLTKAREAALNNDLVTLAREITTQVGNSEQYLNMNRIQQEAIAESVGMTRDGLADVLRQQEYYRKLGADNLKNAQAELKALRERGYTQEQISKMIGEDAYNYITQTSTAERLTEMMNRIKTVFIEFVEKSGILDFITNPDKIQGFVTGLINRLAGAVNMIGELVSGLLETIADVVGFFGNSERESQLRGLASKVKTGAAGFAGSMSSAAGALAPSITNAVEEGAKTGTQKQSSSTNVSEGSLKGVTSDARKGVGDVYLDSTKVGKIIFSTSGQLHLNQA